MSDSKYLRFVKTGESDSGKTEHWDIESKSQGLVLAIVRWYGPWRQYVMYPQHETLFNCGCLDDISDFLKELNRR